MYKAIWWGQFFHFTVKTCISSIALQNRISWAAQLKFTDQIGYGNYVQSFSEYEHNWGDVVHTPAVIWPTIAAALQTHSNVTIIDSSGSYVVISSLASYRCDSNPLGDVWLIHNTLTTWLIHNTLTTWAQFSYFS